MTTEKIAEFIQSCKVAFLGSVDKDGFPNIKAVYAPRKIDGFTFYFSTNTSSLRVSQWRENEKACVYFYSKGWFSYVGIMLTGKIEVLTDQEIKNEIWRMGDSMFYKGGVTDEDYCVLKFTSLHGRWYKDLKKGDFQVE